MDTSTYECSRPDCTFTLTMDTPTEEDRYVYLMACEDHRADHIHAETAALGSGQDEPQAPGV